jgi:SAM-dependent methyltransferase
MSRALARALPGGVRPFGLDLGRDALVAGAALTPGTRPGQTVQGSLLALPFGDRAVDLVVATEVLEHLDRPGAALAELERVSRRYLLLSVPWEPWFCLMNLARLKNVRRLGSDPEHRQHWTRGGFLRFASRCGRVVAAPADVVPWTLVLVERSPIRA